MREILFRAKRVDNGEWIYGHYVHQYGADMIYLPDGVDREYGFDYYHIIPETLGQYTELTDKTDKNGKKIFEGDYIVCSQAIEGNFIDEHIEMGYVEMKHGAFGLHRKQGYYRPFKDWLEDYEYEAIGNIHDNPELLKGE